jgi:hypothetical protein
VSIKSTRYRTLTEAVGPFSGERRELLTSMHSHKQSQNFNRSPQTVVKNRGNTVATLGQHRQIPQQVRIRD